MMALLKVSQVKQLWVALPLRCLHYDASSSERNRSRQMDNSRAKGLAIGGIAAVVLGAGAVTYRLSGKEGVARTTIRPGPTLPVKDGQVVVTAPEAPAKS
jgi:hypothetical protein